MKNKFRKIFAMLFIVVTMTAFFSLKTNALDLAYSGSSSTNSTGATATTSGYTIHNDAAKDNICGYRFSVVSSSGTPKSGTKVVNVYLSNFDMGKTAYSSGQRFIVSSDKAANKKQLANGTKVKSSTSTQDCDYKSGSCGFYSTLPQDPASIGTWIKKSSSSYQNLQRIYVLCGTNLSNATESDYVLIEPIFWLKLASKSTAATATELAIYGAAVSGGDGYKGTNGNLYNAGSGTLWNLSNYINREFPNALYVSSKTDVYDAVTIKTSDKYIYKDIISKGYGCSVLTVKNVITIKQVKIAYHPNGGKASKVELNDSGYLMYEDKTYAHVIKHGNSDDPYNASTFGLTKAGYQFAGWKVKSTGKVLDQDTSYASTVYAHHDDSSKTTANTETVYCYLIAQWTPNQVKIAYYPNGGTASKVKLNDSGFMMYEDKTYAHVIKHGNSDDPYNASTFGLTKTGYTFAGWKVKSTGKILDQDTAYSSTVFAQHNDSTKTTANTESVTCYLIAQWKVNTVRIAYYPNGGTASKAGLNDSGFLTIDGVVYFDTLEHGDKDDPYDAATFGLTKTGYQFAGWKVKSTETILNQSTEYASTVYSHKDDSTKTTANTETVTCYLVAQWTPNKVIIAYHPNGGTTTREVNEDGYIIYNNTAYPHTIKYGSSDDPYDADTLSLTRTGYKFIGWKVLSTGTVLGQSTEYESTVYAHYNNSAKTTANTTTVTCHLWAVWQKNTYTASISHWAWEFKGNGNNDNGNAFKLATNEFTKEYGEKYSLTSDLATTVPNGFYLKDTYGSGSVTGTWTKYPFGTEITQQAKKMNYEYDYYPINYNINYELNGGTNNSNNSPTYNVLYGKTFSYPTKVGYSFLGWTRQVLKDNITIEPLTLNYNYSIVLNDIEPNTEYRVSIGNAAVTEGTADEFSCYLYDFTDNTTISYVNIPFESDIEFTITCPETADTTHDICMIFYSGLRGSTGGIGTEFTDIEIMYDLDGINKGCDSVFSSAEELYSELNKRTTGDITLIANWGDSDQITIVPVDPNAPYREKTEVISSFWLVNLNNIDYTELNGAKVAFSVYNQDGVKIAEDIKDFVCPKNNKNLSFFSWFIPEGYGYKTLIVKAHIIEGTQEYGHIEQAFEIEPYAICKTPDTSYADKTPTDFSVPDITEEENLNAKWWQWEHTGGTFVKKEYAVGSMINNITVSTPKSPTAYTHNDKLYIKSGYGFECSFNDTLFNVDGYELTSKNFATGNQYKYALFPEFNYEYGIDTCRYIEVDTNTGKSTFINADGMEKQHFTPIYYPDGEYKFKVVTSDCWTPAGMIKTAEIVTIHIDGNMYEDWYIQH